MSEKINSNPNPEEQRLHDLANAEAAFNEAAQPVYDDIVASEGPSVISQAQLLADLAGEGSHIGNEAENYLNNGGVAEDLGLEAKHFLYKETMQPISGDEIAKSASQHLRRHDFLTGQAPDKEYFRTDLGATSFADLIRSPNFDEEMHDRKKAAEKQILAEISGIMQEIDAHSKTDFSEMKREYKPPESK